MTNLFPLSTEIMPRRQKIPIEKIADRKIQKWGRGRYRLEWQEAQQSFLKLNELQCETTFEQELYLS